VSDPIFFATPADLRQWFEQNHAQMHEVYVGFYKKGSGQPSITWPESVDQALCFGWIDGVRKSIDEARYMIRFTPRKPKSIWSAVNISRMEELIEQGLVQPTGLAAFEARKADKSVVYSYEQKSENLKLGEAYEQQFRDQPESWAFFQSQAAWYQRAAIWWVISAKREDTQRKRLATLIEDSANGRVVASLNRKG
jgi:uncharacterized protein YdeI (YjbR/CyaY-like superfamily)